MSDELEPTPLRDHIKMVDGPLEGRWFRLSSTPPPRIIFEVPAADGRPIHEGADICENDVVFTTLRVAYEAVMCEDDGLWSRDDQGHLLMAAS